MPGLVPGIHEFSLGRQNVDGRDEPGHDKSVHLVAICFQAA
jgi:hypothetical protein